MRAIDFEGFELRIEGALDLEHSPTGIRPRRLPAWTKPQITDPMTNAMVDLPCGVRLVCETDARRIELDIMLLTFEIDGTYRAPAIDLLVDGALAERRLCGPGNKAVLTSRTREPVDEGPIGRFDVEIIHGEAETLVFELSSGRKRVELWLPHFAGTELRAFRVADDARVEARRQTTRHRWVHYGSSISHCAEADGPTGAWPVAASLLAGVDLQSLAFAGSCHLDQFVARTIRDIDTDFISLKVGINVLNGDTMKERTFTPALHGFLDTIRDGHPRTPIVLASPIICPDAEDHPGPTVPGPDGVFRTMRGVARTEGSLTLRRIREIIADVVAIREKLGDDNLHYVDGLELFGPEDVPDLPDGLHPNHDGYQRLAKRFHDIVFVNGGPFAN